MDVVREFGASNHAAFLGVLLGVDGGRGMAAVLRWLVAVVASVAALDHLRTARPPQRRRLRRHRPAVTEGEVHSALECLRTYALITQDTATAPIRLYALTARACGKPSRPARSRPQPGPPLTRS